MKRSADCARPRCSNVMRRVTACQSAVYRLSPGLISPPFSTTCPLMINAPVGLFLASEFRSLRVAPGAFCFSGRVPRHQRLSLAVVDEVGLAAREVDQRDGRR